MSDTATQYAISRRTLVKGGCVLAAGFALGGGCLAKVALAAEGGTASDEQTGALGESAQGAEPIKGQLAFWVDTQKCDNCMKCVDACRLENKTPESVPARRKVSAYTNSSGQQVFITTSCMHCSVPACQTVCPAGAISKREDGIVDILPELCIGCKYCFQACPFGVPHYIETMDKCDCCLAIGVEPGQPTPCVKACPTGALNIGLIEDLIARSNGRAQALKAPSGPSFFIS